MAIGHDELPLQKLREVAGYLNCQDAVALPPLASREEEKVAMHECVKKMSNNFSQTF